LLLPWHGPTPGQEFFVLPKEMSKNNVKLNIIYIKLTRCDIINKSTERFE
jgi:hypothetical protein